MFKLFVELTPAALTSFTQSTSVPHGEYLLLSGLGRKNSDFDLEIQILYNKQAPARVDDVALQSNIGAVRKTMGNRITPVDRIPSSISCPICREIRYG